MDFESGLKNIQAAAYNVARTVYTIIFKWPFRYENVPNAKQPYKYYGGQLPIRSNSPNGYGQFYSSTGMFKKEAKDTKGTLVRWHYWS